MDQSTREENTLLTFNEKALSQTKKPTLSNDYLPLMDVENTKDQFLFQKSMILNLLFFIISSLNFIPLGLIMYFKLQVPFKHYGWIIIVILAAILLLSSLSYIFRFYLIDKKSPGIIVYVLFLIYSLSVIGSISVLGLYEIKIAFAIQLQITIGLLLLITLNNCFCLSKKFMINLIIIFVLIFIIFILYISFFKRLLVEFFIITIYCSLSLAYLSSLSKYFYEELYNYTGFDYINDDLSFRIHLTTIISSHIDLIFCTFRD